MKLTRRQMVTVVGGAAAALAGGPMARAGEGAPAGAGLQKLPWPYAPLDPDRTGDRALEAYKKAHCMYGAFEAIAGATAEKLGEPYRSFPFAMFEYGAGGICGWGTICGALNGAAAAFQLLSPKPEPLVDALFGWYEKEALPDYVPAAAKFPNVKSVAGSPLCHASVALWCERASKTTYSPERKERCGVLTAAVARRAVQLLNDQQAGKPLPVLAADTTTCMKCHEKGGQLENVRGKMSCAACHEVAPGHVKL